MLQHLRSLALGLTILGGLVASVVSAAAKSSAVPSPMAAITAEARQASWTAWALRESEEFETAVAVANRAIERVEASLATQASPDARRELRELKSRLVHLRQGSLNDLRVTSREEAVEAARRIGMRDDEIGPLIPQMNPNVQRHIDYFNGRGRKTFERWIERSGGYMKRFEDILEHEGVPRELVYLVFVESGFNLRARSYARAVGPWQFIRSTGRLFGLRVNNSIDERRDPEKSTVAAARYLKHLYTIFGDWPLALASYNCGEGKVLRSIRRQNTRNYWDLKLPRQTEEYVPQFMAVIHIFANLEKYGFHDITPADPITFDRIAFQSTVDLRVIAKAADVHVDVLRELNPAARNSRLTGRDGITPIRVPDGMGPALSAKLLAERIKVGVTIKHKVGRGETLGGIARNYGVGTKQLAKMNHIRDPRKLQIGQRLTVPASVTSPLPITLDIADPRGLTTYVPPRNITARAAVQGDSDPSGRLTVSVRRGETLSHIAETYGVGVGDIKRWNRLRSSRVGRGTRLKIRTAESSLTDSVLAAVLADQSKKRLLAAKQRPRIVTVRRGDTLGHIARRYGTTVRSIQRTNGLRSSRIRVGQRLRLPS